MKLLKGYKNLAKIYFFFVLLVFASGCKGRYQKLSHNEDFGSHYYYKNPEIKRADFYYFIEKDEEEKYNKALTLTERHHLKILEGMLMDSWSSLTPVESSASYRRELTFQFGFIYTEDGAIYRFSLMSNNKGSNLYVYSKKRGYVFLNDTVLAHKLTDFVKTFEPEGCKISFNQSYKRAKEQYFRFKY